MMERRASMMMVVKGLVLGKKGEKRLRMGMGVRTWGADTRGL